MSQNTKRVMLNIRDKFAKEVIRKSISSRWRALANNDSENIIPKAVTRDDQLTCKKELAHP